MVWSFKLLFNTKWWFHCLLSIEICTLSKWRMNRFLSSCNIKKNFRTLILKIDMSYDNLSALPTISKYLFLFWWSFNVVGWSVHSFLLKSVINWGGKPKTKPCAASFLYYCSNILILIKIVALNYMGK